jgi:hypothetical protein
VHRRLPKAKLLASSQKVSGQGEPEAPEKVERSRKRLQWRNQRMSYLPGPQLKMTMTEAV